MEYCNGGQHDSQEVLNWFLQVLSETFNRAKPPSDTSAKSGTGAATPASSSVHAVDGAESPASGDSAASTAKDTHATQSPVAAAGADVHNCLNSEAAQHWAREQAREASVVNDTFLGQTQSTVTCSKCGTQSRTYESFLTLQVAMHKEGAPTIVSCCLGLATSPTFQPIHAVSGWPLR